MDTSARSDLRLRHLAFREGPRETKESGGVGVVGGRPVPISELVQEENLIVGCTVTLIDACHHEGCTWIATPFYQWSASMKTPANVFFDFCLQRVALL